jgi:DNA-binding CsgD family transcriptional regulator
MLETIRAYGRERLAEAGEEHGTAAALARYALATAEHAAAGLKGCTGELAAARGLDAEASTVEQALAWSLEHDHATAPRLAAALQPWWLLRGRPADAGRMVRAAAVFTDPGSRLWCRLQVLLGEVAEATDMEQALAHYAAACQAAADGGPSPVLVDALVGRAHSLVNLFRLDEAAEPARAGLAMSRELGYIAGEVNARFTLGEAAFHAGRNDEALSWYRQAVQADPAQVPGWLNRACGLMLANALRRADDGEAALLRSADALSRAAAVDDVNTQAMARLIMADLERQAGRTAAGATHLGAAVLLFGRTGSVHNVPDCLEVGGHLCADWGLWADAVSAWSAATALLRASGRPVSPPDADARQPSWLKAGQLLGPAQMRAAEERGARMSPDAATEFALVLATRDPGAAAEPADAPQLSARERELVTLVAQGRTDAQIAEQLYIAVSTVRSHLDRIRDKTSCRRRADLTRLALQAGLV